MSSPPRPDPVQPADDEARALTRKLLSEARFAALAVTEPDGHPFASRIALGLDAAGVPLSLVSGLSGHTRALRANPACCLLVGEPGPRGDPLTHPRLSLRARAVFVAPDSPDHAALRAAWLARNPKATVYADLPDFRFVRFHPVSAALNGGFARAFALTAADLAPGA
jgi:hypothetical protein